jgi:hypothetical protein
MIKVNGKRMRLIMSTALLFGLDLNHSFNRLVLKGIYLNFKINSKFRFSNLLAHSSFKVTIYSSREEQTKMMQLLNQMAIG